MLYNGSGVEIDVDGDSGYDPNKTKSAVLGKKLSDDVRSQYPSRPDYVDLMNNVIGLWMTEYAGDNKKVPFIVHTDQHGRLTDATKPIFDILSYLVNWDEVSAIFNLGDTVTDHWVEDSNYGLLRSDQLETALHCLSSLPKNKRIEIPGNHDTWFKPNSGDFTYLPDRKYDNPYFKINSYRHFREDDNSFLYDIFDDTFKIRYLALAGWDYEDRSNSHYQYFWINEEHWEWIIDRLSENTGYDTVIISHCPLGNSSLITDPTGSTNPSASNANIIYSADQWHKVIFSDRKRKQSGVLTNGTINLPYDFTNCTDNLLCAFAGHVHLDCYDWINGNSANGLLQICFDYFANNTIHFGLIDRRNNKIVVYKISTDNNPATHIRWEIPFNQS